MDTVLEPPCDLDPLAQDRVERWLRRPVTPEQHPYTGQEATPERDLTAGK